jgi:RecA-family ATPase
MDLRTLVRALGGKVNGPGSMTCPGPGHKSPKDRSLSIKLDANNPDGFVVHSFADDDPIVCRDYVREKLGLGAFKHGNGRVRRRHTDDEIVRALASLSHEEEEPKGKVVDTSPYRDSDGTLLYENVRYEPKTFRQRRPNGSGGWIWNLDGVRRVLYRWPELLQWPDATVFVCEGEKDVDRLWSIDHCATGVASGVWTEDCIKALAERDVIILQDNDPPGRKKALTAAHALHGVAKSIRIVLLPDLPPKGDVSDWLDADPRRANKLTDICFDAPEWSPESTADEKPDSGTDTKSTDDEPAPPLPFINIGAWQDRQVPERIWTVQDRIPGNNVTLLSGEGSIGKSILSLHLSTAIVLGKDWLQSLPDPGPAIVVCCEDDVSEIWRRLDLIFAHFGAAYTEFKDLHVLALAGEDALMATPDRNGLMQPTKLFTRIAQAACDVKPRLVVLDNSADTFGGNENDRAQVRQFIGILRGLAISAGTGALLTSHPSLTGISSGSGLSGSTAWNASVRSRLYFKRAETEKGEEPDPDLRVLEVMKTNYGRPGEAITLKWNNGLFLPVGGVSGLEKIAAEQNADNLFLELLDAFMGQGRNVSHLKSAHNYAPTAFARDPKAKAMPKVTKALADAMERLFAAKKIRAENYGRPSRPNYRIIRQ